MCYIVGFSFDLLQGLYPAAAFSPVLAPSVTVPRLLLVQKGRRCFVNSAPSGMAEECLDAVGEIVCCIVERIKALPFGRTL